MNDFRYPSRFRHSVSTLSTFSNFARRYDPLFSSRRTRPPSHGAVWRFLFSLVPLSSPGMSCTPLQSYLTPTLTKHILWKSSLTQHITPYALWALFVFRPSCFRSPLSRAFYFSPSSRASFHYSLLTAISLSCINRLFERLCSQLDPLELPSVVSKDVKASRLSAREANSEPASWLTLSLHAQT